MTFPRLRAMNARWREVPPAALQLARIAAAIGLKPPTPAKQLTVDEFMEAAQRAGMPIHQGRPDDPMLDILDQVEYPAR